MAARGEADDPDPARIKTVVGRVGPDQPQRPLGVCSGAAGPALQPSWGRR